MVLDRGRRASPLQIRMQTTISFIRIASFPYPVNGQWAEAEQKSCSHENIGSRDAVASISPPFAYLNAVGDL